MAATQAQATGVQSVGSVASVTKSYTSSTTTGNNLIASVSCYKDGAATTFTVADNKGNGNFTSARRQTAASGPGNVVVEGFYKENASGGSSHSITATPNASAYVTIAIEEWSGLKTSTSEDVDNSGTGSSTTPSSGAASPTGTCVYIGAVTHDGATTTITPNTGGGWTQSYEAEDASNMPINAQYIVGTGSKTATWTLGASRAWTAIVMTFQEAAAGTTVRPRSLLTMGCGC